MSLWFSRIVSAVALYVVTAELWLDIRTLIDPNLSFESSIVDGVTPVVAVVNAVLLPFVAFLVYFANWGRPGWQVRVAVVALCATALAPLAYIVVSLSARYPLPGNYMVMELVVAAFMTAFLWFGVALGVLLRWQHVRPSRHGTHPRCEGCGYDLTGNVTRRCPECGKYFLSAW